MDVFVFIFLELDLNPTTSNAPSEDENKATLNTINNVVSYMLIGVGCCLFLIFILWMIHNVFWSGSDVPDYGSVIRYIHSVVDFWTDVLFAYSMYLNDEMMHFYGSAIFTILPLCFSMGLSIYWIYRWRTMTASVPQRIADYLNTYTFVLVLFTVFGSFPSAVALAQSRLFHHPMYSLSLKKKENDRLSIWKFVNSTLLEVSMFDILCSD